jgi:hemoglobin
MSNEAGRSLYQRLGGYDAIEAVCSDLLPRLMADPGLGRFWQNRGEDGIQREKQLLVDYLCNAAGGPVYYTGRDMKSSHAGMGISNSDWQALIDHLTATLDKFGVPDAEKIDLLAFIDSTKADIVEVD